MGRADYSYLLRQKGSALAGYQRRMVSELQRRGATLADVQGVQLDVMGKVVEATFDAVLTIKPDGRIETANAAAARTFKYSIDQLTGLPVAKILPHFNELVAAENVHYAVGLGHRETVGNVYDGKQFPVDIVIDVARIGANSLLVLVARDITELREQQKQLEHQALHDALTGLPNRVLLANRIEHALALAHRNENSVALMLLDLDRFKEVNDTLGHHVGDLLLQDLSLRLKDAIRASDTVARLGGDEFAILLPMVEDENQAHEMASRVMDVFGAPFQLSEELQLEVGCSIGIAMFPTHGDDAAKLMQCADVAMYAAKSGSVKIMHYDSSKDTNSLRQLTISGELRQSIQDKLLTMEFQPQLDLSQQVICSVEGLARWRHPRLGYVSPDEFIKNAEQAGIIRELTQWTFVRALEQLTEWQNQNLNLSLAINLSAKLLQDNQVADQLKEMLSGYSIRPQLLTLEITESALMADPEAAREALKKLANLGIKLSIDDFGTGYSSLSYLQKLPLDELKIDKSFVFGLLDSHNDGVIVRSTIDLAHNLGLTVVAEGVESPEHIETLAHLECDIAQGFCISPALTPDLLNQWIVSSNRTVARIAA